eukprot:TRINITY_DN79793_c0_g1_i1.p1 TRINITY_DN79793_c0_g1~~TRINITY_DN79793_c0_g1_i1.p1  ORF type:complete len:429 (-),score=87.24 TRINITY_DN79793_c0_g1_i1:86-1324(-)
MSGDKTLSGMNVSKTPRLPDLLSPGSETATATPMSPQSASDQLLSHQGPGNSQDLGLAYSDHLEAIMLKDQVFQLQMALEESQRNESDLRHSLERSQMDERRLAREVAAHLHELKEARDFIKGLGKQNLELQDLHNHDIKMKVDLQMMEFEMARQQKSQKMVADANNELRAELRRSLKEEERVTCYPDLLASQEQLRRANSKLHQQDEELRAKAAELAALRIELYQSKMTSKGMQGEIQKVEDPELWAPAAAAQHTVWGLQACKACREGGVKLRETSLKFEDRIAHLKSALQKAEEGRKDLVWQLSVARSENEELQRTHEEALKQAHEENVFLRGRIEHFQEEKKKLRFYKGRRVEQLETTSETLTRLLAVDVDAPRPVSPPKLHRETSRWHASIRHRTMASPKTEQRPSTS